MLLAALPLLALITAQFQVYCQDGCGLGWTVVSWLWVPLIVLWLALAVVVIVSAVRFLVRRSRRSPPG